MEACEPWNSLTRMLLMTSLDGCVHPAGRRAQVASWLITSAIDVSSDLSLPRRGDSLKRYALRHEDPSGRALSRPTPTSSLRTELNSDSVTSARLPGPDAHLLPR